MIFVHFQAQLPKGTTLDLSNNHLVYLPVSIQFYLKIYIQQGPCGNIGRDNSSCVVPNTVIYIVFNLGKFSDVDSSCQIGLKQEPPRGTTRILRPAEEPKAFGFVFKSIGAASSELLSAEKSKMARFKKQSLSSSTAASSRTLYYARGLHFVLQKGKDYENH